MDELMEVSFSPIAATGKPLSRCGKCHRFMKYIQVSRIFPNFVLFVLNFEPELQMVEKEVDALFYHQINSVIL